MAPDRSFSVGRTGSGPYVNFSAAERQKTDQSGKLKAFGLIGITFGLLCIIQVTLNFTLGLHGAEVCNSSDVTGLLEAQQLELELLNIQLQQKEDVLLTLQKERDSLRETITDLRSGGGLCHGGWRPFRSSCYRLSKRRRSWWSASDDCEARGAHLVILGDAEEEVTCPERLEKPRLLLTLIKLMIQEQEFLQTLGASVVWIGVSASQPSCPGSEKTWTWVDGRPLTEDCWIQRSPGLGDRDCVSAQTSWTGTMTWVPALCGDRHHWVCEKLKS
ncbi:uncharacterized protein V6R79_005902 [Siganus canaliculatus]